MDCVGVTVPLVEVVDDVAWVDDTDVGVVEMGEKSLTELVRREIVFSAGVAAFCRSSLTRWETRSRFCLSTSDIAIQRIKVNPKKYLFFKPLIRSILADCEVDCVLPSCGGAV